MSFKQQATSGFIWNAVERFSVTIGQFVIGIVLARLLTPEDFGLIGMLSIFITVSQVFIESGMNSGLIQKKNRNKEDYSTVFVFNFFVSASLYLVLFVSSPYIASFYEMPMLEILTKILGLTLLINAFGIVQRTLLEIELNFKKLARINVIAILVGGGIAVLAAYLNFGVWALVIYTLSVSFITTVGLWVLGIWKLSIAFSKESFNRLFGYGSKILIAVIYGKLVREAYNLVIGKTYSTTDLGYYTQARKITDLISSVIADILKKVSFPLLASIQDDKVRLASAFKRIIRMTAFISFPIMISIAILAEPIILFILSEKWISIVPLVQIFSLSNVIIPISVINMNILNAIGRSDLFLKIDLIKFPMIVITFLITIPIGLEAIVLGQFITTCISFFINSYLPGKFFKFGAIRQLKDMKFIFLSVVVMASFQYLTLSQLESNILELFFGSLVGLVVYVMMSYLFNSEELVEFKNLILKIWKNH